ncbi:MAG: peptide deformylase, partial [Bacilli bacterium]|nr:peptide deformylase [Bacilli bacterium]
MIREIIKDQFILSKKSSKASLNDIDTVNDLIDTLKANQERCVGMAANMIGVLKNIIVF